jgi:hypothetical protein
MDQFLSTIIERIDNIMISMIGKKDTLHSCAYLSIMALCIICNTAGCSDKRDNKRIERNKHVINDDIIELEKKIITSEIDTIVLYDGLRDKENIYTSTQQQFHSIKNSFGIYNIGDTVPQELSSLYGQVTMKYNNETVIFIRIFRDYIYEYNNTWLTLKDDQIKKILAYTKDQE